MEHWDFIFLDVAGISGEKKSANGGNLRASACAIRDCIS